MPGTIGMRSFFKKGCAVLAAVLVSACQPTGSRFLTTGIGTELSAPNTAQAEQAQLVYFNYLCRQSGVGSFSDGKNCISGLSGASNWTQLTYQGMNDIDRRCDGYLEWLDNKKRSRGPVIKQLGSLQNAATQLIDITSSAAGALKAITIVSQAFDLITQSVENYHSRLLLEIDQRTINTIVLQARHKFRRDFSKQRVANKPQSEYVLRSYLRICLPFAIESVINGNATLVALGVSPDEADDVTIHKAPVLNAGTEPFRPQNPVRRARRPRPVVRGAVSPTERRLGPAISGDIQSALCLTPDGELGPQTRAGIRVFEQTIHTRPDDRPRIDGQLDEEETNDLLTAGACNSKFGNFYERTLLADNDTVLEVANHLSEHVAGVRVTAPLTLADLRPSIRQRRTQLGLDSGPDGLFSSQITPEFLSRSGFSLR